MLSFYGVAALVYDRGILNWTGVPALQQTGGIQCLVMAFSCNGLLGVSLDYDIFLFSRVVELRFEEGLSQGEAVRSASTSTSTSTSSSSSSRSRSSSSSSSKQFWPMLSCSRFAFHITSFPRFRALSLRNHVRRLEVAFDP